MQKKEREKVKKLKYDPIEGLLPEIRKNVGFPRYVKESPAKSVGKKKKQAVSEEIWLMPEAQNCGLCSTGGTILCCETCPASFHLDCIGMDELPPGNFYCNRCQNMPPGIRLYPPEKCSSSTSPTHRIENEIKRNWETMQWHYDRFKKEREEKRASEDREGPMNEVAQLTKCWPDPLALKALGMANQMDFNLPPEYLLEREFFPFDRLEVNRTPLVGLECTKCNLQDDWSPMLTCNYCNLPWHQKCVDTPLIHIPLGSYWRCPNHAESLFESIWTGDQVAKEHRKKVYKKYNKNYNKEEREERQFKEFWKFTCQDRIDNMLINEMEKLELQKSVLYAPESDVLPTKFLVARSPENRKERSRKNDSSRFFGRKYGGFSEKRSVAPKVVKSRRKSTEEDDSDSDDKRSRRFTDEELISSIMPFNENYRNNLLSIKSLGMDVDMYSQFSHRHSTMIAKSQLFYSNFSENELTKLMRRDLDPEETFRGSGIQNIIDYQEKTARKKLKGDVESLIQLIGFGNAHADRRFTSHGTEALFRRYNPPPNILEAVSPGPLREVVLSSQKACLEMVRVYQPHPNPENIQNLVILAYDLYFGSQKARDEYWVSSMTFWSKEPIAKIVQIGMEEKWPFEDSEEEVEEAKNDALEEAMDTSEVLEEPASEDVTGDVPEVASEDMMDTSEARDVGQEDDAEIQDESEAVEKIADEDSLIPLEEVTAALQQCAVSTTRNPLIGLSSSVAECLSREYDLELLPNLPIRKCRSESDVYQDAVIWSIDKFLVRNQLLRQCDGDVELEHNYPAKSEEFTYWDDSESEEEEEEPLKKEKERNRYIEQFDDAPHLAPRNIQALLGEPQGFSQGPLTWDYEIPGSMQSSRSNSFSSSSRRYSAGFGGFKKRGRPLGSKNKKDLENPKPPTPAKRGGRGRGGSGRGGAGRSRARKAPMVQRSTGGGGEDLRTGSRSPSPTSPGPSGPSDEVSSRRLKKEVEEVRQRYVKKFLAKSLTAEKNAYFETRDAALEHWTKEDWTRLKTRCFEDRLNSLIPYDPRFFLPNQRVHAKLVFGEGVALPIAIQRCLTKIGTATDCHVRIDRTTSDYCSVLADYHCDIVRDYYTDVFYLSTLATEHVIVNGVVLRRPQLAPLELAEKTRFKHSPTLPSELKCRCQLITDQLIIGQEASNQSITSGVIELKNLDEIQIGCARFTFVRI